MIERKKFRVRPWTMAEERLFRENYAKGMSYKDIAKLMGRSLNSINGYVSRNRDFQRKTRSSS